MTTYEVFTNAGPIFRREGTPAQIKRYMERHIPLLDKRGYTHTWTRSRGWFVINIFNSKGRQVHSAAFRKEVER